MGSAGGCISHRFCFLLFHGHSKLARSPSRAASPGRSGPVALTAGCPKNPTTGPTARGEPRSRPSAPSRLQSRPIAAERPRGSRVSTRSSPFPVTSHCAARRQIGPFRGCRFRTARALRKTKPAPRPFAGGRSAREEFFRPDWPPAALNSGANQSSRPGTESANRGGIVGPHHDRNHRCCGHAAARVGRPRGIRSIPRSARRREESASVGPHCW